MLAPRTATAALRADALAIAGCERSALWLTACAALEHAARGAERSVPPRRLNEPLTEDLPELARALHAALHGDTVAADLALGESIALADEMAAQGALSLAHSTMSFSRALFAHSPITHARALATLALVTARLGDLESAREQARDACRIGHELHDTTVQGRAYIALALVSEARGNIERASKRLRAALRVASHVRSIASQAHLALMRVDDMTDDPDDAMLNVARIFRLAGGAGTDGAELLVEVAGICLQVGRARIARQTALAAVPLAENPSSRLRVLTALATTASALGDRPGVVSASCDAEQLASVSNEPFVATLARVKLAEAHAGVGAIEDAVRLAWIASLEAGARGYTLLAERAQRATDEKEIVRRRMAATVAPHGQAVTAMLEAVRKGGANELFCLLSSGAA